MRGMTLPSEADAVFEGGGVKGIAFAGAVGAAQEAGVREWKNLAGTSAGAIAACLLAVGYHAEDLKKILLSIEYRSFADYGRGGLPRGVITAVWRRGLAPAPSSSAGWASRSRNRPSRNGSASRS
jgi:predicted acylesterase/phospholipase RssA